jgi:predicted RNase H-like HicB family nuclease
MKFDDYKIILYRQDDGSWVAEIPSIPSCYALMDTREEALAELVRVFDMIAETYRERGIPLPADTTEPLMPSAKGGTSRELQYS